METFHCTQSPLTLRYTDNKEKAYNILEQNFYSLLCGYCLSFTPSPLAATLFLMSHCGLQLHGSYFWSAWSSTFYSSPPPFPQRCMGAGWGRCLYGSTPQLFIMLERTWESCFIPTEMKWLALGHTVLELRDLALRLFLQRECLQFSNQSIRWSKHCWEMPQRLVIIRQILIWQKYSVYIFFILKFFWKPVLSVSSWHCIGGDWFEKMK